MLLSLFKINTVCASEASFEVSQGQTDLPCLYQVINKHSESSVDLLYPSESLEAFAVNVCDLRGVCLKTSSQGDKPKVVDVCNLYARGNKFTFVDFSGHFLSFSCLIDLK